MIYFSYIFDDETVCVLCYNILNSVMQTDKDGDLIEIGIKTEDTLGG